MPTFDAMELIWNSLENKEGDSVRFVREDIATLWDYGFVDTKKYSKESWIDIFDSYKQPDGTYRFTQEEFATLEKYRYQGPIKIPFDPTLINEGKYTEEGFWELVDLSIAPSCSLAKRELQKNVEEVKKKKKKKTRRGRVLCTKKGGGKVEKTPPPPPPPPPPLFFFFFFFFTPST